MTQTLDQLRRAAKRLQKHYDENQADAVHRLRLHPPRKGDDFKLKRADFLHVIAQENGFESWPKLKLASEIAGYEHAEKQQRLKIALIHGQSHVVAQLLVDSPHLADGAFGLQCALLDLPAVRSTLAQDPDAAIRTFGPRRPILHLAFSRYVHARPDLQQDMLAIAELLVSHGADVNDGYPFAAGDTDLLSALYGALGHADNLPLAAWLLAHGANPNDNESLYHSTELGHSEGLALLLKFGADPKGTNALLRALDFNNHVMVEMLLRAGSLHQEGGAITSLHQAARRGCDAEMARLLLRYGADVSLTWEGRSAHVLAQIYGNTAFADVVADAGGGEALSADEQRLADAAVGLPTVGLLTDPTQATFLLGDIIRRTGGVPHAKALVALGADTDALFDQGLPLLQVAGWEGQPEAFAWALTLSPDLSAVNGYGGDLMSTIVHGSENCPARANRDHIACARLALTAGAVLAPHVVAFTGEPAMAEFLESWDGSPEI